MLPQILYIILKYSLLFLILPTFVWIVYVRTSRFHVMLDRIPGPRCLPIVGNALRLGKGPSELIRVAHDQWVKQYGDIYRMFVGVGSAFVMITSPELAEPILKSQKLIEKGVTTERLRLWLGYGLVTSGGENWRWRRKLINPSFHTEILNNFMEIFNEQARIYMRILKEKSDLNMGKPVEVSLPAAKCALDVICETVLGVKINAQTTDSQFARTIHRVGEIIIETQIKPWLRIPFISDFTTIGRDRNQALKFLIGFADKVINERKQSLEKKKDYQSPGKTDKINKKRLALLDMLLSASEDGRSLDVEEIRSEIYTFFFAGHDTTAVLVGWFLYLMAAHPECQEKVKQELSQVFGNSERSCTPDDLSALKYMDCCIKETLRLYPSIPAIERLAIDDVNIGNYVVPKGSNILISMFALHRNPKHYEQPDQFNPSRFQLNELESRHPYSFVPFSSGPRNCIGQRFAMMEAKVILSTLLHHLKFGIDDSCKKPIPSQQVSLKSTTGINLLISSNQKN